MSHHPDNRETGYSNVLSITIRAPVGAKNRGFGFRISRFSGFWVFGSGGDIAGTKRAAGDPLVTKRSELQGLFLFSALGHRV